MKFSLWAKRNLIRYGWKFITISRKWKVWLQFESAGWWSGLESSNFVLSGLGFQLINCKISWVSIAAQNTSIFQPFSKAWLASFLTASQTSRIRNSLTFHSTFAPLSCLWVLQWINLLSLLDFKCFKQVFSRLLDYDDSVMLIYGAWSLSFLCH